MKKVFRAALSVLLIPAAVLSAHASSPAENLHTTFQVSFFPPLSTNGRQAHLYTNDISINLLAGVSKNEDAFAFAGLANIIKNNAHGFQFGGLANIVGHKAEGFQFGGLANIVGGNLTGGQFAGLFNKTADVEGFQFGGLGNFAAGDVEGFQFGGLGNFAAGDVEGFQFGGLGNIAREIEGFQFGGLANIACNVDGLQFAGLFNVANRVSGAQFAGLVNIAQESDCPIGLVNIIREGEMSIGLGYNETGTASLTFRSGGRVTYGILGVGYNHKVEKSKNAMSILAGYGAHINVNRWFRINNELTTESFGAFGSDITTFKSGYALLPAFRPVHNLEIFGGPSINYMHSEESDMFDLFPKNSLWDKTGTTKDGDEKLQKLFIGWQVGVHFLF